MKIQDRILEAVEQRLDDEPVGENVLDRALGTAIDTVIALQRIRDDAPRCGPAAAFARLNQAWLATTPAGPGRRTLARLNFDAGTAAVAAGELEEDEIGCAGKSSGSSTRTVRSPLGSPLNHQSPEGRSEWTTTVLRSERHEHSTKEAPC